MTRFVAYYRVSTDRQGQSGLGLEAQRAAVAGFVAGRGELLAECVEVESGRRNDRPELLRALELCRQHRAVLAIAKLDRLARNVAFVANLMESGVEFVAVDMPQANRLTIHILAAVAEHEREMISQRTSAALAAAKARGVRLGNPNPSPAAAAGRLILSVKAEKARAAAAPVAARLRGEGKSLREVAATMNALGVPTLRGRQWHAATVRETLRWREAQLTASAP